MGPVSTISIGLAELLPSDVLGASSEVVRRSVEGSQDPETTRRGGPHQAQGMLTQLFGLLGFKLLDDVVQIAVVMGGSHQTLPVGRLCCHDSARPRRPLM